MARGALTMSMYWDSDDMDHDACKKELEEVVGFLREVMTNNPKIKVSDELQDWWEDRQEEDLREKLRAEAQRKAAEEKRKKRIAKLKAELKELEIE